MRLTLTTPEEKSRCEEILNDLVYSLDELTFSPEDKTLILRLYASRGGSCLGCIGMIIGFDSGKPKGEPPILVATATFHGVEDYTVFDNANISEGDVNEIYANERGFAISGNVPVLLVCFTSAAPCVEIYH